MQLLDKKQINHISSIERKNEIDQGMHLARKVDSLRTTVAEEEKNLAKFRENAIQQVVSEVQIKTDELKNIKKDIEEAHLKRLELEKPLTEEWQKLEIEKSKIQEKSIEIQKELDSVWRQKKQLRKEKSILDNLMNECQVIKQDAQKSLDNAKKIENKALELSSQQKEIRDKYIGEMELIQKDLAHRENKVSIREKNVSLKEQSLKEKERELILTKRRYT